jgi:hypothetical protein
MRDAGRDEREEREAPKVGMHVDGTYENILAGLLRDGRMGERKNRGQR